MAAAAVTSLKTEPGVKAAERQRLIYAPSAGTASGSAGSMEGVETMHSTSPLV